ncbi:MAG: N-6 DNA methylase, partial [Alistipes sp.]|nr:N-6 DNA methylase [Alistipes sp.]
GTIYDPCCGSGGMFVQSMKFIEAHGGNTKTVHVYGQEQEPATYRLAKMNLAVRGISYDLGDYAASTFTDDHHSDKKVDYIMANPPFNLKKWRTSDTLLDDYRWKGYGLPPESNANYAWILHMLSKLNTINGIAGFLLANGALDDSDTLAIRQKLIEKDKVEAIIVLPREMFYSTDISVTLWILNNNKRGGMWHGRNLRNREKEILFVDLRTWSQNIYEKKYVKLTEEQIADVCKIYFDWQTLDTAETPAKYEVPELYRSVGFEEIKSKNFSLVPSRYIEFVDRDTELDYDTALNTAGEKVRELLASQSENNKKLVDAFKVLGYDAE